MYMPNAFNTPAQRRFAFPGTQIAYEMISRNIGIPFFTNEHDDKTRNIVMAMYAKGRCLNEGWAVASLARPLAGLEVVAPNIEVTRFLAQSGARKAFVRAGLRYLVDSNFAGTYSTGMGGITPTSRHRGAAVCLSRLPQRGVSPEWETVDAGVRSLADLDEGTEITDDHYTEELAQAIAAWLHLLAKNPTNQGKSVSTNIYVITYLGIAKRGTISEGKLAKINDAISNETNMVLTVTESEVEAAGAAMSPFITGNNAEQIMEALAAEMDGLSLTLQITMLQTSKSGMTSYWCIRNACMLCPNFGWGEASRYIPEDFNKFQLAFDRVGGNQYYGFNKDLGDAKHTNYISLAWIAMKLLMKADPVVYGKLKDYKGFTTKPRHEADLNRLIDAWVPGVAARPIDGVNARVVLWGGGV